MKYDGGRRGWGEPRNADLGRDTINVNQCTGLCSSTDERARRQVRAPRAPAAVVSPGERQANVHARSMHRDTKLGPRWGGISVRAWPWTTNKTIMLSSCGRCPPTDSPLHSGGLPPPRQSSKKTYQQNHRPKASYSMALRSGPGSAPNLVLGSTSLHSSTSIHLDLGVMRSCSGPSLAFNCRALVMFASLCRYKLVTVAPLLGGPLGATQPTEKSSSAPPKSSTCGPERPCLSSKPIRKEAGPTFSERSGRLDTRA